MSVLAAEDLVDLRRWVLCGAAIVLAHGGIAAAMVTWHEPVEAADTSGAIVVDFAPIAVGPTTQESKAPPGPEQVQSDAVPDKPIEKVEEEHEEQVEAKAEDEIEQKIEPEPVPEPPREAVPVTTAPAPAEQTAALPAAPVQGPTKPDMSKKAVQAWIGQISSALERHKRYPRAAEARREQVVAEVSFTLDRRGHVLDSRIVRSSGTSELDAEALAMLDRAQPFPPWPARDFGGEQQVNLTVPIRFSLK